MPLALKPGKRFPIVLAIDKDEPEDKRPTFWFRFITGAEWMDLTDCAEGVQSSTTGREALGKVYSALRIALVDWQYMTDPKSKKQIPYEPAKLETLINPAEAKELLQGVMKNIKPAEADLGN